MTAESATLRERPYSDPKGIATFGSGEHRLPACCPRQLAEDCITHRKVSVATNVGRAFRQAAEKDRLAACALQSKPTCAWERRASAWHALLPGGKLFRLLSSDQDGRERSFPDSSHLS
jgi:hypothetical protein